jgi:hypothetical protein
MATLDLSWITTCWTIGIIIRQKQHLAESEEGVSTDVSCFECLG